MYDPDVIAKLQPVDDPIRIAALFQNQFPTTGPESLQGLGDVRREPIGNLRQGTSSCLSRFEREIVKIFPCPFDLRNVTLGFADHGAEA